MRKKFVSFTMYMAIASLASGNICRAAEATKAGQSNQWTFDKEQAGKVPVETKVLAGNWAVRAESDAPSLPNVLCQTGYADYPALSLSEKVYDDVTVTTRFKPVSGNSDRAAGIIFRIQDKDNYYILRANALEDNVNIYKYVGGWRRAIQESSAKVPSGTWQELHVEVKGNHIRGFLNGKQVVEATDDTFKAGKIGLWTKADSVICFDNVIVNQMK
jgi:3-keto-disaccharide hydrolase